MVSICTSGCFVIEREGTNEYEDKYVELTEEEKKLLIDEIGESRRERIENGILAGYERDYLEKIRDMKNYLKKKYPSYDIEITRFSTPAPLTVRGNVYSFYLKYDDESFEARIGFDSENNPIFRDDFFGYILKSKYDPRITKLLHDNGIDVHSYTRLGVGLRGEDVDENKRIDEYRVMRPSFEPWTYIYIEKEEDKDVAEAIRDILIKEEISDGYVLIFVGKEDNVEYADTYKNRRCYPSYRFEKGDIELKRCDEEEKE